MAKVRVLPQNVEINALDGQRLLDVLPEAGIYHDAPCGGKGTCGKCKVSVDGKDVLACQTTVCRDMTVTIPCDGQLRILQNGIQGSTRVNPVNEGYLLAIDIGTTSVVCFLLDGESGEELAQSSMGNPQAVFGADVISRIQAALRGERERLTRQIREGVTELIQTVCGEAGVLPQEIGVISLVGNPAMQQLFLGISPENLAGVPFAPVLTEAKTIPGESILPICPRAQLLIVPDISGYIGADTMGCVLATELHKREQITLLVDIGTNGEMVLGNKDRMIACAAAAGPALEGANIQFGMRAQNGAIDRVFLEDGEVKCSVIGGGEAKGICGSGLIDAVAVALTMGVLNQRGRIQNEGHIFRLAEDVYLTQEDIRQVQLAKGAIHAGIRLMAKEMGIEVTDIQRVLLAGAFGNHMDPQSACCVGLLPEVLLDRIEPVGNAAGSGAKMLACDRDLLPLTQVLSKKIEFLELASLEAFPKTFAKAMNFSTQTRWLHRAKELGFETAVLMDAGILQPREDVRAMCAADKCGAYNKNWMCPPAIGSIEACRDRIGKYRKGILLQTVGKMEKTVDSRCYRQTERRHMENLYTLAQEILAEHPDALCLGAGACRVCKACAYPEPCRFPGKAMSSMEGYGLFVTQVCRDAGVAYYYGERTITYTACILLQ